jgi:exopolyphosphatase/guanosine-5'-triphosphate,3'-diphosphate pyrophosphatase
MRVCAIDIGTNSVRTIVADVEAPSRVRVVRYDGLITRLGEGFGASKRLRPEAIARTVDTVSSFAQDGRELGAAAFKFVATSAARDAENGREFLEAVREATGQTPEIVTGEREGELVLAGVMTGGLMGEVPTLVVDVGGGSTELIACAPGKPPAFRSVSVGAVRLTEQLLTSDPPTDDEVDAAAARAAEQFEPVIRDVDTHDLIGLGGTVTTMATMLLDLEEYDAAKVHGYRLTLDDAESLLSVLVPLPLDERKTLPGLSPRRADVIVGGMLIVRTVLELTGCDAMRVSSAGILHGIALAAASGGK